MRKILHKKGSESVIVYMADQQIICGLFQKCNAIFSEI